MIYAVDRYTDHIRVREKPHEPPYDKQHIYCDSEALAHAFIIARAQEAVEQAEETLFKARGRLSKCLKKFGQPFAAQQRTQEEK